MHKIYFIGLDGCMFYAVLLCFVRKQCNSYQPSTSYRRRRVGALITLATKK